MRWLPQILIQLVEVFCGPGPVPVDTHPLVDPPWFGDPTPSIDFPTSRDPPPSINLPSSVDPPPSVDLHSSGDPYPSVNPPPSTGLPFSQLAALLPRSEGGKSHFLIRKVCRSFTAPWQGFLPVILLYPQEEQRIVKVWEWDGR